MAFNLAALKGLFGKLMPAAKSIANYGDDVANVVANYGDDVAGVIANYGDDAAKALTTYGDDVAEGVAKYGDDIAEQSARDLPFVGVHPRQDVSYDLNQVYGPFDNYLGEEVSSIKLGDKWFDLYKPHVDPYDFDSENEFLEYLARDRRINANAYRRTDILEDIAAGNRRWDSPVRGVRSVNKAMVDDALANGIRGQADLSAYRSIYGSPYLKKRYEDLHGNTDWDELFKLAWYGDPDNDLPF